MHGDWHLPKNKEARDEARAEFLLLIHRLIPDLLTSLHRDVLSSSTAMFEPGPLGQHEPWIGQDMKALLQELSKDYDDLAP